MDTTTIVALIVGLFGGGGIASFLSQYFSYRISQTDRKLQKLERLHTETNKYFTVLSTYFLNGYPLVKGEISYNQYLDLIIQSGNAHQFESPHYELEMLIDIHFPQLNSHLKELSNCRDNINTVIGNIKRGIKTGTSDPKKFFGEFDASMKSLIAAMDTLKSEIVNQSKSLI